MAAPGLGSGGVPATHAVPRIERQRVNAKANSFDVAGLAG
jgi:hypothetical protein